MKSCEIKGDLTKAAKVRKRSGMSAEDDAVIIHVRIPRKVSDDVKWLCEKMGVNTQGQFYRWIIEAYLEAVHEEGDEVHMPAVVAMARSYVHNRRAKLFPKEKPQTPEPFQS